MDKEEQRAHFRRILRERVAEIVAEGGGPKMDPNATLQYIRTNVSALLTEEGMSTEEMAGVGRSLAESVDALDQWITRGGFLPAVWNASHPPF